MYVRWRGWLVCIQTTKIMKIAKHEVIRRRQEEKKEEYHHRNNKFRMCIGAHVKIRCYSSFVEELVCFKIRLLASDTEHFVFNTIVQDSHTTSLLIFFHLCA